MMQVLLMQSLASNRQHLRLAVHSVFCDRHSPLTIVCTLLINCAVGRVRQSVVTGSWEGWLTLTRQIELTNRVRACCVTGTDAAACRSSSRCKRLRKPAAKSTPLTKAAACFVSSASLDLQRPTSLNGVAIILSCCELQDVQ